MGSILSQEEYLYSVLWPMERVDYVIDIISGQALHGDWDYDHNMGNGIRMCKSCLDHEFGVCYSDEELLQCINLLHQRFTVWKDLMADPDVLLNKYHGRALAKPAVWERLVKNDSRVKWYGIEGEKAYEDLEVIFANPYKGKEDFVHLGQISGLHTGGIALDQVELPPLPAAATPPRGPSNINMDPSLTPLVAATLNETFSPGPAGSPSLEFISKKTYNKSAESKNKKKLFFVPDSPHSSAGSTNQGESSFAKLRRKFKKSG